MATDVIIDPSSGQIYWNDGTGSPQSISLGGNAQDTITATGYSAAFSPGSAVGGTTVLVRFTDSALETLAPGTNGFELGSSTLRWKLFATTGNFSDSTNSTSLTSGAFQILGGIAVSGNASVGQTALFWTPGGVNYIGLRAPASAGNTTYVLPSAAPISGATGTSVLSSDQTGILSWVPMVAGGAGGGSSTISVVTAGLTPTLHPLLFTPTQGTSSAAAVSSDTTLLYLPSTETLYVSGILVTSTTVSSNQGTGAILIAGGMGVSGQINAASMQIAGNAIVSGNLQFNGNGTFGNATSDTITSLARYASDLLPSADNTYDFGTAALGWRNTYFSGIGTFAGALRVTSNTSATSTASGAFSVTGGIGIQGNAFIGGTTNFAGINLVSNNTSSTSTTTGALLVVGGFGLQGNAFIGGTTNFAGITLISNNTSSTSTPTGSLVVVGGIGIQGNAFIGGTTNFSNINLISNNTSSTSTSTGSLVNVGGFGLAGNAFIGGSVNAAGILLISNNTSATSTGTGSLVNVGGFGLQGNAFIGGSSYQSGAAIFANSNTSISTTTGALIVAGGVGIGGSLNVTTSVPSNISGFYVFNGVLSGTALTALSVTTTNIRTTASTLNIVDSGTTSTVLNYNGTRFGVLIAANSTSSSDGALVTSGGAGFGATINVAGNVGARSGYELRAFNSGDSAYTGLRFTGSASTTYILPLASPATGTSVLQSTSGGVMSWVPLTSGGGSPGGSIGDIQLNSGSSTFTSLSASYLNVSTTTGMMKHIGYNSGGTSNSATVNAFLLGSDGSQTFSGQSKGTILALDNTSGNGITYNFIDAQYFDGTPSQKSVFKVDYLGRIVLSDLTITGSNYSGTRFFNTLKTSTSQASNVVYSFPLAAPGAGQTFLTADTAGNMYWVATPAGGSATPSGSNKQIQYNNSSAFGGATGFEYVSAGSAVTVSYFSAAGGGNTVGMVICSVNATTTRVGIGLTNPAFELEIRGEISATNKSFVIDHPTKPGMKLRYGSLEGPENGVYVRGQLLGKNIIETPDYWRGLVHNDSYTIHLTPIGNYQQLYVEKIQDYKVYVGTASTFEINCFYSVWAERKDISKLTVEY